MNKYKMTVILEPHIEEANGRRYLSMEINADNEEQAKDYVKQMIGCLLKTGVDLMVRVSE